MNCKISWTCAVNVFFTVLNFTSTEIKFGLMFRIKFCIKCDSNFEGFLKIQASSYDYVSNLNT
jgi:hypothetical protein